MQKGAWWGRRTEVPLEPGGGEDGGIDADGQEAACRAECAVVDVDSMLSLEEYVSASRKTAIYSSQNMTTARIKGVHPLLSKGHPMGTSTGPSSFIDPC